MLKGHLSGFDDPGSWLTDPLEEWAEQTGSA